MRKRYREKGMKLEEMKRVGYIKEHIYREGQAMIGGSKGVRVKKREID